MRILFFVLVSVLMAGTSSRIIEITSSNVHLVLRSVSELTLLLNDPQCPHSSAYAQKYLKIEAQDTIGITDCQKDKTLCEYLNATHYPTLLLVSNDAVRVQDEYEYLLRHRVIDEESEELRLKDVLELLRDGRKWAAVVLEELQMPIIDKVDAPKDKRVVYVSNPSKLHKALTAMVGNQLGCWILVNNNNNGTFDRYFCGTGYRKEEVEKNLNNFIMGKLDSHTFSKEPGEPYVPF
jgi:hypothetical protein